MAIRLEPKTSETFLKQAFENVQIVLHSKSSSAPLYMDSRFQISRVKSARSNIHELFLNCLQWVFINDSLPQDLRLRNLRLITDLKKILTADYPESSFTLPANLTFPCLKTDHLSFRLHWVKTCKHLLAIERLLMLSIGHKVLLCKRIDEFFSQKPKEIKILHEGKLINYHIPDPEVTSARMAAFLFQVFKDKAFETPDSSKHFKFSKGEFKFRFQNIANFCFEEETDIADYAKLLYWIFCYDDSIWKSLSLNATFIEHYNNFTSFKDFLKSADTLEPLKPLLSHSIELNELLLRIPKARGGDDYFIDISTIPSELYDEIIRLFRSYEASAEVKADAFNFFSMAETSLKETNRKDAEFKRQYLNLNRNSEVKYLGINLTSYSDINIDATSDDLLPLIDSEEFQRLKPRRSPLFHFDKLVALELSAKEPQESKTFPVLQEPEGDLAEAKKPEEGLSWPVLSKESRKVFDSIYRNRDLSRALKHLEYHERVLIWHDHPQAALDKDYKSLPEASQKHIHFIHSFPFEVDKLLGTQYSAFMEWRNPSKKSSREPDWLLALPCEVQQGSSIQRGFLVYTIDPKSSRCYHRCFDIETKALPFGTAIMQGWGKIAENFSWKERDYPTLETAAKTPMQKRASLETSIVNKFFIDSITNILTIQTKEGVTYRFFKIL